MKPQKLYLINVAAQGMTSGYTEPADDLFDVIDKVRRLQAAGTPRIVVTFSECNSPHYLRSIQQ